MTTETSQPRESADVLLALVRKLNPRRFSEMSPKMGAIVGCILGYPFTEPCLIEMAITADGIVLGRRENDVGLNDILGSVQDLERNWRTLLDIADLDQVERDHVGALYATRIKDWRRP